MVHGSDRVKVSSHSVTSGYRLGSAVHPFKMLCYISDRCTHTTPALDLDSAYSIDVWLPITHVPVMEWWTCHNSFKQIHVPS